MKRSIYAIGLLFIMAIVFQACNGGNTSNTEMGGSDIVVADTLSGIANRIDPESQAISIETDDGQTLDLNFTEQTIVTQNGQVVSFDALEEGQQLRVEVEKTGESMEPVAVSILN